MNENEKCCRSSVEDQNEKWKAKTVLKICLAFASVALTLAVLHLFFNFSTHTNLDDVFLSFDFILDHAKTMSMLFFGFFLLHIRTILKNWNKAQDGTYDLEKEFAQKLRHFLPKFLINYPLVLSVSFGVAMASGFILSGHFKLPIHVTQNVLCILAGYSADYIWENGNILGIFKKFPKA